MISAKEARFISDGNNPKSILVSILNKVEQRAREGEYECIIRDYGFSDGSLYCSENDYPEFNKKILSGLRTLGYTAEVVSVESQFVDIYLKISW